MDYRGDFNEIIDDVEKCGRRRKFRVVMEDFQKVIEDFTLVDVKPDHEWFTWTNNRIGDKLVKERTYRFLVLTNWLGDAPFLLSNVMGQASSDHDVILLNTLGQKLREDLHDPRLSFIFKAC